MPWEGEISCVCDCDALRFLNSLVSIFFFFHKATDVVSFIIVFFSGNQLGPELDRKFLSPAYWDFFVSFLFFSRTFTAWLCSDCMCHRHETMEVVLLLFFLQYSCSPLSLSLHSQSFPRLLLDFTPPSHTRVCSSVLLWLGYERTRAESYMKKYTHIYSSNRSSLSAFITSPCHWLFFCAAFYSLLTIWQITWFHPDLIVSSDSN